MKDALYRAWFFCLAGPAVLRAVWRLHRLEPHWRLDELADRLREVQRFRVTMVAEPRRLAAAADRWLVVWRKVLGIFGSRSHGHCLDLSLILLDLWSRCGQRPSLCIGAVHSADARHLHAWVTLPDGLSSSSTSHREIWAG